jgi:hypothetical protein
LEARITIDTDLLDAELEKWKAEVDHLSLAMERLAGNEEGLTVEQSQARFADLQKTMSIALERLLKVTRALDDREPGNA